MHQKSLLHITQKTWTGRDGKKRITYGNTKDFEFGFSSPPNS